MPEHVEVGTARLLSLVSWIGEHPGVEVAQAARHFGRTEVQLRRDLETLGGVGDSLPGSSFELDWDLLEREDRLRVHTTLGIDLPPRLTRAEVTAVLVGLRAIAPVLDDDLRARLPSAAMTVATLATDTGDLSHGVSVSRSDVPDPRLDLVRRALADDVALCFTYTAPDARVTRRRVDPWELRRLGGGWALRGWCHTAGGPRTFRIEGMSDLEVTTRPISHAAGTFLVADAPRVRLRLAAGARWVLDEVACDLVSHDGSSFTIEVSVWNESWVDSLMVDLSAHLLEVEPPSWAGRMHALARRALAVWEDGAPVVEGEGTQTAQDGGTR